MRQRDVNDWREREIERGYPVSSAASTAGHLTFIRTLSTSRKKKKKKRDSDSQRRERERDGSRERVYCSCVHWPIHSWLQQEINCLSWSNCNAAECLTWAYINRCQQSQFLVDLPVWAPLCVPPYVTASVDCVTQSDTFASWPINDSRNDQPRRVYVRSVNGLTEWLLWDSLMKTRNIRADLESSNCAHLLLSS